MDAIEQWSEFNVAMLGATAALAGLVIVAVTINVAEIVKDPSLTARVASAIGGLVLAIATCAIGLVPELDESVYGTLVLALAVLSGVFATVAAVRVFQNRHPWNRLRPAKAVAAFLGPVVYAVGAVVLLTGSASGLVWLAAGALIVIVVALLVSWIVLVEVLR